MTRFLVALVVAVAVAAVPAAGSPAQAPQRGGTLVVGGYLEPACLSLQRECDLGPLLATVLDGGFGLKGSRWVPRLVERVTRTRDPLTLAYHIRPEARWSDGMPVTSADFVFTHRIWTRTGLTPEDERLWASVRPLGRKSFRVRLTRRSADWHVFPHFVAPRHVLEGQDLSKVWRDTIDNPRTGEPIGSGPFLLRRWVRGSHMVLVRNPRFWGTRTAHLDRLIITFHRGQAAVDAFLRGELDVLPFPIPQDALPRLRATPGVELRVYPGNGREHLQINVGPGGHRALENKLVRRALAYGIDRVAIVRELSRDFAPGLRLLDNLLFLAQQPGYRANWVRYRFRPATARRLLEQAGCRRGADRIYDCMGERLSLRFLTTAGNPRRQRTLELLARQLRQAGVEVVDSYSPTPVLFGQLIPSGQFDVALLTTSNVWPEDLPDGSYLCQSELNLTGYCNRLVTRDLAQLDKIFDFGLLAPAVNAADRKLAVDVPAIPLFQSALVDAIRTTVGMPVPSPYPFYLGVEDWWLARRG